MATTAELLAEWAADTRPRHQAPELWKRAARAFGSLAQKKSLEPELFRAVVDRFLAEEPAVVYRAALSVELRPDLLDALGRCTDVEARLLVAAAALGEVELAEAGSFVALIAGSTNCPACAQRVVANAAVVTPGVVARSLEMLEREYPPFSVSLAGVVTAVAVYGSPSQVKALWAVEPPDDAIMWLEAIARKMPLSAAARLRQRIAGRNPAQLPSLDGPPRYTRRVVERPAVPSAPRLSPRTASAEALLAAVYAAPQSDDPRAVYADYLLEHGSPLGELLQLQLARARGKRGTLAQEQLVFEKHRDRLWPEHPCAMAKAHFSFDDLDRGFPARFNLAYGVSLGKPELPPAPVRKKLLKHPGWGTVRRLRDGWRAELPLEELLPDSLPLLERVQGLTLAGLHAVRGKSWPVQWLELVGEGKCGEVTGLRQVSGLELQSRTEVHEAVAKLEPTGLLARVSELQLVWLASTELAPLLEAAQALPGNVKRFGVRAEGFGLSLGASGEGAPTATLELDAHRLDDALDELTALAPSRFSSLHVVLSTNGFFTKKTRPLAEAAAKRALRRFKEVKLTSTHPS